ncbi:MAG: radical SAM protein [Bradyrhizobium sp.]|nr:radical SAM protein [Bradyrhizobium sp.]
MRVLYATLPGRFPTVGYDPGPWWDSIAVDSRYQLSSYSINFDWWTVLIGQSFTRLLLEPLSPLERQHRRAAWCANGLDVDGLAAAAAGALKRCQNPSTYRSRESYIESLAPLHAFIALINRVQSEFLVDVDVGPHVRNVDYSDSRSLVDYSRSSGLLSRSIDAAIAKVPTTDDVVLFSITCPEDLLTALMTTRKLRSRRPDIHISLIDHGYENFSLSGTIETLRARRTLDSVFDTIISSKDERDEAVPALLEAIAAGRSPKGIIWRRDIPLPSREPPAAGTPFPPPPTFAPESILWTRLSKRRCYWSRCTFCSQNAKFDVPKAPMHSEILASLDRIAAYAEAGYSQFMFSDEALSPSSLNLFANELTRRGLHIKWACRSKLERAHTPDLFNRLGESGCFEILFGVETISQRILALMDKVTEGLDAVNVAAAFRAMTDAKVGIHVTLIAAFPSETVEEVRQTVAFIGHTLSACENATFALNEFQLFADTPIGRMPSEFGLSETGKPGDICGPLSYKLAASLVDEGDRVRSEMPRIRNELDVMLGWLDIEAIPGGPLARHLYFYSGHGAIFKSRADNPFANLLHASQLPRQENPRPSSSIAAAE